MWIIHSRVGTIWQMHLPWYLVLSNNYIDFFFLSSGNLWNFWRGKNNIIDRLRAKYSTPQDNKCQVGQINTRDNKLCRLWYAGAIGKGSAVEAECQPSQKDVWVFFSDSSWEESNLLQSQNSQGLQLLLMCYWDAPLRPGVHCNKGHRLWAHPLHRVGEFNCK